VDLQKRNPILDAEDVATMHFIKDTINVLVVVFQRQNAESIPGLNGIHRCKRLQLFLVH
jgi:hypothetical protein